MKAQQVQPDEIWAFCSASEKSPHALHPVRARSHVTLPTEAQAHAAFRLGQHLLRTGNAAEGGRFLAMASQLHPESWNLWRQRAGHDHRGLAALPDFWERVQALGSQRYYAPVDLPGMPK